MALAWVMLALVFCVRTAVASAPVTAINQAEAAPSGWNATTPPATGWKPVKLTSFWTSRWPHHSGVVWYRLHWNQASGNAPVGLLVNYVSLAAEVWVNGSLVYRDAHLSEPVSRSWIAPQYFLIDRPLLRAGQNTVLVRVSGFAAYQPGLGIVSVGQPQAVRRLYRHGMFWRYYVHVFNFAMGAVLGVLFLLIWLLRRSESAFGWYALTVLLGAGYDWNYIASSPWPFASTNTWEALNAALFTAQAVTFCIFLLRFCERRWARTEAVLLLAAAASIAAALLLPGFIGPWRDLLILPTAALYYAAIGLFVGYAVRVARADLRVMAACLIIPIVLSVPQLLVFLDVIHSTNYDWGALATPLGLIGLGFAVAWRFSDAMRRVEGFNAALQHEVTAATTQLSQTLSQQHALALANAHANERLGLVRDLHDGFGGSLVGAITKLEFDTSPAAQRAATTLKELRDDLRLVIDTTTHEQDTDLAGLLAPLRHRWSQRFELVGIDSRWQLQGLDNCRLGAARSLDVLRFLQECLTNVLKHSHAARVDVAVVRVDGTLRIAVRDDGRGFDATVRATGAGMASLAKRSARLGGTFALDTVPGAGTTLRLDVAA